MIVCVDVHYAETMATTALIVFEDWSSAVALNAFVHQGAFAAEYESGAFYKRELPCILDALAASGCEPETIVIDGYVWLDGDTSAPKPGLGAHLYEALGKAVPVIGVAKNPFQDWHGEEVLRGTSRRPLYVTAAGVEAAEAAQLVRGMHGDDRLPTMIKLADQVARTQSLVI